MEIIKRFEEYEDEIIQTQQKIIRMLKQKRRMIEYRDELLEKDLKTLETIGYQMFISITPKEVTYREELINEIIHKKYFDRMTSLNQNCFDNVIDFLDEETIHNLNFVSKMIKKKTGPPLLNFKKLIKYDVNNPKKKEFVAERFKILHSFLEELPKHRLKNNFCKILTKIMNGLPGKEEYISDWVFHHINKILVDYKEYCLYKSKSLLTQALRLSNELLSQDELNITDEQMYYINQIKEIGKEYL